MDGTASRSCINRGLRANQGHDGMAFRQGGTGRSAVQFRPLHLKQELSSLTSIFLDVSAAVPKEPN
jgi:hypothetical protein